jgi:hypothetical protein
MGSLIDEIEQVMDDASFKVLKQHPDVRQPIKGWDGTARCWIFREVVDEHYSEATARLEVPDTLLLSSDEEAHTVAIVIEAKAWSSTSPRAIWSEMIEKQRIGFHNPSPDVVEDWVVDAINHALNQAGGAAKRLPETARRREELAARLQTRD